MWFWRAFGLVYVIFLYILIHALVSLSQFNRAPFFINQQDHSKVENTTQHTWTYKHEHKPSSLHFKVSTIGWVRYYEDSWRPWPGGVPSRAPNVDKFDPRAGHIPRLWALSQGRVCTEGNKSMFLSLSLSPHNTHSSLSL